MSIPEPMPSASVILIRPVESNPDDFEIYLLKRRDKSTFMPNRFVFPGGRVEPYDGEDSFADSSLRACALRELWEESGVVLADDLEKVANLSEEKSNQVRSALQQGSSSLEKALSRLELAPGFDQLFCYARWITPLARHKRYDTVFYTAIMPKGQTASSDHLETTEGLWLTPQKALDENRNGNVSLAPPQVRILGELALIEDWHSLLTKKDADKFQPILPIFWAKDKHRIILFPWDPEYDQKQPSNPNDPGKSVKAGLASRLVLQKGRWRPMILA